MDMEALFEKAKVEGKALVGNMFTLWPEADVPQNLVALARQAEAHGLLVGSGTEGHREEVWLFRTPEEPLAEGSAYLLQRPESPVS